MERTLTLSHIACCRIINVELRFLEYIGDSFDTSGLHAGVAFQAIYTISHMRFEIHFHVEVWISVLLVCPPTFSDDAVYIPLALRFGLLVRFRHLNTFDGTFRRLCGLLSCQVIVGKDCEHFARILRVELLPELLDRVLRCLLLRLRLNFRRTRLGRPVRGRPIEATLLKILIVAHLEEQLLCVLRAAFLLAERFLRQKGKMRLKEGTTAETVSAINNNAFQGLYRESDATGRGKQP